jgi:glucose/arabinose dehydrogenase
LNRASLAGGLALTLAIVVAGLAHGESEAGDDSRAAGPERARPIGDGRGGFHLSKQAHFDRPVYVHGPVGAGDTVFVVEREGRVKILRDGRKRGTFLNITGRVSCCRVERGMFSIAFPDFADDRHFYVYYTDNQGDIRIDGFLRKKRKRFDAIESSGRKVMDIGHRANDNHYGGQLQFGPDGFLYIGTGDGGGGGDPGENAQDKGSLLGKILRINPKRRNGRRYTPAPGNPYKGRDGRDEIYARGLRNPWRFAFDAKKLFIADVGQERREEVNMRTRTRGRGANFGWDVFEGTLRFEGGSLSRHDKPIHQYSHSGGNCSITGGYVSRNPDIGSLWGRYIYGDLCTGKIRSFKPDPGGSRDDQGLGVDDKPGLTSFGRDARKRLYVAQQSGGVFRIADG